MGSHEGYKPVDTSSYLRSLTKSSGQQSIFREHFSGWRFGVVRSALAVWIGFIFNLVLTVTLWLKLGDHKGSGTLLAGSCSIVRAADILAHLALNISSTLILGASNFCMQGLCSPTREEVDKAHREKRWLDIGMMSYKNLKAIKTSNAAMLVLLGLASLPLHLV
jgi:hypothetical protein